jgi:hypothetical protein
MFIGIVKSELETFFEKPSRARGVEPRTISGQMIATLQARRPVVIAGCFQFLLDSALG